MFAESGSLSIPFLSNLKASSFNGINCEAAGQVLLVYCTIVTSLLLDNDIDSRVVVAVAISFTVIPISTFVSDPPLFNSFKIDRRDSTISCSSTSNIEASCLFFISIDDILIDVATDAAVAGDNKDIVDNGVVVEGGINDRDGRIGDDEYSGVDSTTGKAIVADNDGRFANDNNSDVDSVTTAAAVAAAVAAAAVAAAAAIANIHPSVGGNSDTSDHDAVATDSNSNSAADADDDVAIVADTDG